MQRAHNRQTSPSLKIQALVLAVLTVALTLLPVGRAEATTTTRCHYSTCETVIYSGSYVADWDATARVSGWSCHSFDFYVNGSWVASEYACAQGDVTAQGPRAMTLPSGSTLCVDATNASGYPCLTIG